MRSYDIQAEAAGSFSEPLVMYLNQRLGVCQQLKKYFSGIEAQGCYSRSTRQT